MARRVAERGFSLIELMVAMVITLIVSGAIYGLLASGQSAFRREPALVDRQQNIRLAMDLIMRDVQNAGAGMSSPLANMTQVFTTGLNNPTAIPVTAPSGAITSEIVPGERADHLEIMANDGSCPAMTVCGAPGGGLFVVETPPACMTEGLFYVSGTAGPAGSASTHPGLLYINMPGGAGGGNCSNNNFNLPAGQANAYNPGGNAACSNVTGQPNLGNGNANTNTPYCQSAAKVQLVRYELAPEDPTAAVHPITNPPALWRSDAGRRDYFSNTANNGPYLGNSPNNPWQLVARGIDDMQVQYFVACPNPGSAIAWCDSPGVTTNGNGNTVVRQVRITLSARALGQQLGGETTYAVGGTAGRRGQLTTTVTPRAAMATLDRANQWR